MTLNYIIESFLGLLSLERLLELNFVLLFTHDVLVLLLDFHETLNGRKDNIKLGLERV